MKTTLMVFVLLSCLFSRLSFGLGFGHVLAKTTSLTQKQFDALPSDIKCRIYYAVLKRIRTESDLNNRSKMRGDQEEWAADGVDGSYGDPDWSYNQFFASVLGGETLEGWAARRRTVQKKKTNVLDVFGSAYFSDSPENFDSLYGLRLRAPVASKIPPGYENVAHHTHVLGDILNRKTWQALDTKMENGKTKVADFDLIVIRPVGPLLLLDKSIPFQSDVRTKGGDTSLSLSFVILDRSWKRLSSDGGMMLVQIGKNMAQSEQFQGWVKRLSETEGVEVQFDRRSDDDENDPVHTPVLKIIKKKKIDLPSF